MGYNQDYVPLKYNGKRINEDVSIRQVIALYTDINTETRGNVSCPSVSHIDKKPSAKIYDQHQGNNCHCFSCGKSFKPIDIVMEHKGVSFPDACKMLISDFGLPMSQYSNIEEVERVNGAIKKGRFVDSFPLNKDECKVLGYENVAFTNIQDNPNYGFMDNVPEKVQLPSLSDMWNEGGDSRKNVEDMLFARCSDYKEMYADFVQSETERFNTLYSLRDKGDWNEAKLIQKALVNYNVDSFSKAKLAPRQRELANDIQELYGICENIECYETLYRQVDAVEQRLIQHKKEREKEEQKHSRKWER